MAELQIDIPAAFAGLFQPSRRKTYYGGRGSGKSWAFADALIAKAHTQTLRILCAREFQSSMTDSVHRLLSDRIAIKGLDPWFTVQKSSIVSNVTGSEFLFKGLRHNVQEIKSTEGVDICWVEEAQSVSAESWQTLIPTIRKDGSEVWISFNPAEDSDPTYQRFVVKAQPGDLVRKVGWEDNPYFPATLDEERRRDLATDPDAYEWIWGGECRQISEAQVFRGRVSVEAFETPETARFFFGADWGFAIDPTVLVRCWVRDDCLFVDHEAYAVGRELDDTPSLFDQVPGARRWPIKADSARPETISYIRGKGFNISAVKKWPGSVEDGISRMKAFRRIVVHERCVKAAQEFRLYSYKVDRQTGDVLPVVVDKHNHIIDSIRYSLDGYIKGRGTMVASADALALI